MKELKFSIFTENYETVDQIIDRGLRAELIRNNPAFRQAIDDLYQKLTLQEDTLIGQSERTNRDKNADQRHYSLMRALLVDLVLFLDEYIVEAKQLQEAQSDNNLEEPY